MLQRFFCIIGCLLAACVAHSAELPVQHITYDEFVQAVEDRRIKEVRFYNLSGLEGEMRGSTGVVRYDAGYGVHPADDPLLLRLLKAKDVKIERTDESKFPRKGFGYSSWQLMQFGFLMTAALLVVAILQLRILRRLEKKNSFRFEARQ